MVAVENIFGDHYGTSVVSPACILCLCFLFLFVVFQQKNACRASVVEMLFKFSSVLFFSKYHDCKRRTEVLVLFCVFRGHVVFESIYFFFCLCDNRPRYLFHCHFSVLFG